MRKNQYLKKKKINLLLIFNIYYIMNIDNNNLMEYIQNQMTYLDEFILSRDNITIECMHRNKLCWKLSINKSMRKQTIRELKIEFLYEMVLKIFEINESYVPIADNVVSTDYFKIN